MARDAELRAKITAKDDASKVIDKVADAAKDLEKKPVEVKVDADVAGVLGALDQVAAEAKATAEAAEALGRALGPELAAKADPGAIVGDLKNMGLTLDQIKGNADELGAKMRELSDVDVGGKLGGSLGTVRGKMDEAAKSADSFKSVNANLVGNSIQDLGALSGVAGSAGVAIGQLGEYMVDARNSGDSLSQLLGSFAKVAGPLAAVAAATQFISDAMKANEKAAALAAKNVERFTEAIQEGGNVTDNYVAALRETEDAQVQVGNAGVEAAGALGKFANIVPILGDGLDGIGQTFGVFGKNAKELSDVLHGSGLDVEAWGDIVTASDPAAALAKLETFLHGTNLGFEKQRTILHAAQSAQEDYAKSVENAARADEIYGKKLSERDVILQATIAQGQRANKLNEEAADRVEDLNRAYRDAATDTYAESQKRTADAIQRVNDKLREQADALNEQIDAARNAADSNMAYVDSQDDFIRAHQAALEGEAALLEARKKHGESSKEAQEATADLNDAYTAERDALIDAADAAQRLAADQSAASGKQQTATDKVDSFNNALLANARYASPAARQAVYDYLFQVNQIPPDKVTEIQALIDQGLLEEANTALAAASATRQAAIIADAQTAQAERDLDQLTKTRTMYINAKINPNYGLDQGGVIGAGPRMAPAPTMAPPGPTVTQFGATVDAAPGTQATTPVITVPVAFKVPTAAELIRRIGPIRLPLFVQAGLLADRRINGNL